MFTTDGLLFWFRWYHIDLHVAAPAGLATDVAAVRVLRFVGAL